MEEFDKYDILDFLEYQYIDYLEEIDKKHFIRNRVDIEKSIILSTDTKICDFLVDFMSIDIDKLILKNLLKIDIILFKHYFEKNENIYLDKFKKNSLLFTMIFNRQNLDFNKYVIEKIYSKLYKNNLYKIKIYKDEIENIIANNYNYTNNYNVFFYVIEYLNLSSLLKNQTVTIKRKLFINFNTQNPIVNFDELQLLIKKLGITKTEFENNIIVNYLPHENLYIFTICKTGDIELFIKIINNYYINYKILTTIFIIEMFTEATKSNNADFIIILLNYLINSGVIITTIHYTEILNNIFRLPNYTIYNNIIKGFIELGGKVISNPIYKEYAESIEKI